MPVDPASVRPMLATTAAAPLESADFAYEPKYDGIRVIVIVEPGPRNGPAGPSVHLWSRLGNEKTGQFAEVADAVRTWARHLDRSLVLDGEVVALDERGNPIGFQNLQRMATHDVGIALVAFDLLRDGREDVRDRPLRERRARLETVLAKVHDPRLRISEQAAGDGREMHARAKAESWEGLIAKRLDSLYHSGKRSPDWRKLKLERRQTCVIGGWTDPRGSRSYFGALLLGVYDSDGLLQYIGHSGAGFSGRELERVWKRLQALETTVPPFAATPRTNERPHWVRPELVADVKFTEWTRDNRLRHPTYLGLREDIPPTRVHREPDTVVKSGIGDRGSGIGDRGSGIGDRGSGIGGTGVTRGTGGQRRQKATVARASPAPGSTRVARASSAPVSTRVARASSAPVSTRVARALSAPVSTRVARALSGSRGGSAPQLTKATITQLLDQIDAIDDQGGGGTLQLPSGDRLDVSNLHKVFWPARRGSTRGRGLTKGDLFRHYTRVAPYLLPALADRPLVMKRYPNGVGGKPFYQHRAPDKIPAGVQVEVIETGGETRAHLVGGSLTTLLYTAQLASISQDPWFSRVHTDGMVDHVAIDLDPPEGLPFRRVLDVARWVHDEIDALGAPGFAKTSGSGGLHIYVPMPPDTPYPAGLLFAQIVATLVARKHPKAATVERAIKARGTRIYVDYLQNMRGKTLASAYSVRASEFAGVSTPVTWTEIDEGMKPQDFTLGNFAGRLEAAGDLWAKLRQAKGADLRAVMKYAEP